MILAVSTGLDSFTMPTEIGPLYPFSGQAGRVLIVIVAAVLWLLWHIIQARGEIGDNRRAVETYERIGLDRVMFYAGSADVPSDEEWELRERRRIMHPSAGEPILEDPQRPPVPPGRPPEA